MHILYLITFYQLIIYMVYVNITTSFEIGFIEPERIQSLFETLVEALQKATKLCNKNKPENAQYMIKYGGIQGSIQAYYALKTYRITCSSLALRLLLGCIEGNFKVLLSIIHYYGKFSIRCYHCISMICL